MLHTESYIQFLKYARNLSATTCKQYSVILGQFAGYLIEQNMSETQVSESDVMRWVMMQTSSGVKAVTVNNRIVCMRRYYDYCVRLHSYPLNPFVGISPLKVPKLLPKFIPDDVITRAVSAIDKASFFGVRDAAVIMTLYCTGIRRTELLTLFVGDIDTNNMVVHIFGKGRKERLCPIPQKLLPFLLNWNNWRRANCPSDCVNYFCCTDGRPLSATALATIVRSVFQNYVSREYQHPHILRHSFATVMMQAGVPIPDISRLLGHNSTVTTLRYLSLSPATQYSNILNSVFK